jgi:hypothetical protein
MQPGSGREQDQAGTSRRGGVERRVEAGLGADDYPKPGAGVLEDNRRCGISQKSQMGRETSPRGKADAADQANTGRSERTPGAAEADAARSGQEYSGHGTIDAGRRVSQLSAAHSFQQGLQVGALFGLMAPDRVDPVSQGPAQQPVGDRADDRSPNADGDHGGEL